MLKIVLVQLTGLEPEVNFLGVMVYRYHYNRYLQGIEEEDSTLTEAPSPLRIHNNV